MVLSSLPQRSSWGNRWWMCTWKNKRRQIPLAMQRYIRTRIQGRNSNISKNGAMVGDACWGSSLGLLPSFFWRLLTKTEGQITQRGAEQTVEMGWWQFGQKLARGENKERRGCQAQRKARLGNGDTVGGLPFYTSTECNGHPKTKWCRDWQSDPTVETWGSIMVSPWGLGDVIVAAGKR
jgi:hypothetical protein